MYMQYCEHLHVSLQIISHWVTTYLSKVTLGAVSVGAAHKHSVCHVVLSPSNCSEGMRATGIEQYVMVVLTCLLDSGERRGGRREGGRGGREGRKGGRGGREKGRSKTGEERVCAIIRAWLGGWCQSAGKFDKVVWNTVWNEFWTYWIESVVNTFIPSSLVWWCIVELKGERVEGREKEGGGEGRKRGRR